MHEPGPAPRRHRPPTSTRRRLAAALGALVLLAGACGGGDDGAGAGRAVPDGAAPAAAADDDARGTFPVTVEGANGEVRLDAAPQRIVSLSPTLTEVLFAIGAGAQVVAVDRDSDHPGGVPATDLSGFRPSLEGVAAHEPDLVLVAQDRDGIVGHLGALGIPVLVLSSADGLEEVYRQVEVIGAATGNRDTAANLVARMRADIDVLAGRATRRPQPLPYYLELSSSHHTVTSSTFIGEVMELAGLRSIADDVGAVAGDYPQLAAEAVIAADPDVIFVARSDADVTAEQVASRPGWSSITAVTTGRVVVLDEDVAARWGPRVVDLLRQVVEVTAGA